MSGFGHGAMPAKAGPIRLGVLVALAAAVEAACRLGIIPATTMIAPSEMVLALAQFLTTAELWNDLRQTFTDLLAAFAAAVVSGICLGFVLHLLPRLRRVLQPLFSSYYAVPIFAFYPLLIINLGMNDAPIIVVGYLGAVVAVIVNTVDGLGRVPPVLLKSARMYRMGRLATAWRIQIPAAAPHLFAGVKLALAYSFTGIIASEFLLSDRGLGYSVAFTYNNFDSRKMYAMMLLVLLLAAAITMLLHRWEVQLMARRQR